MQNWQKLGRVFCPGSEVPWMVSHAAVPFTGSVRGDVIKVYFTFRNVKNQSNLASLDLSLPDLSILHISKETLFAPGENGMFDHDGVMGSQLMTIKDTTYLYYQGWNLATSVPFRNSIGVARMHEGKVERIYQGPILDRSIYDPCFVATPHVIKHVDSFVMYYLSCFKWVDDNGALKHQYNIKYAFSKDGIKWEPSGKTAIDFKSNAEFAISVPRVILDNGLYKMWYSYRSSDYKGYYRIGYAESHDAFNWVRKDDEVGIDVSDAGWDSEMICYPYVFDHKGSRYMLYNGNNYGKTGFGLAILRNG